MMTEALDPVFEETAESLKQAYEKACGVYAIEEQMLGNDFANKHFYISPEAKGASVGRWKSRKWQEEILNCMCSLEFVEVSWRKASRMGASKMMVAAMVMAAIYYKFNCLMYHPTDPKSDQFVKVEIDPCLRDCESLHEVMRGDNNKKDDTLDYKGFIGSVWHFLGGATGEAYRQLSVDWNFNDELSAFLRDISDEGDGRALSKTRVTESPFQKQVNVSSPKITGECLISEALAEMDFLFRYYVPCPECGEMQYMDFNSDEETGVIWDLSNKSKIKETAATAHYICTAEQCRHKSSWATMMNMVEAGKWMTEDQSHWLEDGRVWGWRRGKKIIRTGERWSIGFDSNIFISEGFSFSQFAEEYIRADRMMKAGRTAKMKTLFNTRLSRTWDKDKATETIDYRLIKPMHYPTEDRIPEGVVAITSTVDVHQHRLEILTVGWGSGEESWALDYDVIPGEADKSIVWNALSRYWTDRKYTTENGRRLGIRLHGIDHGGTWTSRVENFCKLHGVRTFLPIKGFLGVDQISAVMPTKHTRGVWLVRMNTDPTKSLIYRRINMMADPDRDMTNTEGLIHFPIPQGQRNITFDKTFYKGLTSEQREITPKGTVRWLQKGKNEPLDLYGMNHALITIGQTNTYGINLDEIEDYEAYESEDDDDEYDFAEMRSQLHG